MILQPYILAILLPFLGAALIPFAALLGGKARLATALVAGLGTAICSVLLLGYVQAGPVFSAWWAPRYLNFGIGVDGLSAFMAMVAGVLGLIIMVYSFKYMADEADADLTRYYLLFLVFIGGMMGLVLTTNLLILYFFWEMVGLCSYALIGFDYRNPQATAAGIKAFLTTRIGDVGLFAGIMALYLGSQPHTFEIQTLIKTAAAGGIPPETLAFAGFALIAGAAGKSAQVPLHVWLPDAMEAPTPISALIHAATMVNAGVYLMARVYPLFAGVPHWSQTLLWLGVITAFLAGLAALVERDLKRLLAYSTVSQLGFMMFAVGNGGLLAAQFHLVSHAVFKALLFLCAGSVIHAAGTREMGKMGGYGRTMKATAAGFAIGACALAGVPFFNGFFSKDMIFAAAYESGNYIPLILAVLTAAMTVAYIGKAFVLVFLGQSRAAARSEAHEGEAPAGMVLPTSLLALGALTSWLAIGVFSGALAKTGAMAATLGVGELLRETFAPTPALAGSLCALILGGFAFFKREAVARTARRHLAPVLRFIRAGYGFDTVYTKSGGLLVQASRGMFGGYDEQVADGLDVLLVRAFNRVSRALRKGHTGDLGLEALGIMLGLLAIFAVVFWK